MKRLLYTILLFVSCNVCKYETVYAQMTVTQVGNGFSTLGIGSSSTTAYAPGELWIAISGTTNASGTPATVSLSGTSQTWTEIKNQLNVAGNARIQIFRWAPTTSNTSTNIVTTYTGTQDGGFIIYFKVTGANVSGTNGSNAIAQSAGSAANASTSPTVTLSAVSSSNNVIIAGFISDQNPFGSTPESGWTKYADNGYATPTTGGVSLYRVGTTDNTPSCTTASCNYAGVAIEIKSASKRRVFVL